MESGERHSHHTVLGLIENRTASGVGHQFGIRILLLSRSRIDGLTWHTGRLTEKAVQFPERRLLRLVEGIVVALIALQLLPKEHACCDGSGWQCVVIQMRDQEIRRAVFDVISFGGNQVVNDLVPWTIRRK